MGRREATGGTEVAFATGALAAANPMLVWYSQEARTYSLLFLLAAVTLLALALLSERQTTWRWALWSAASAAALLTHYFAAFLFLPQLAILAWQQRDRLRTVALGAIAPVLTGIALLPLARSQEGSETDWIAAMPIGRRLGDMLQELVSANTWVVSSSSPSPQRLWWVLAAAGVAVAILGALTAGPSKQRRLAAGAAAGAAAVIALPLLLAIGSVDYLFDRNVIVAWPLLLLALGAALVSLRTPAIRWMALAAIVLTGVATQAAIVRQPDLQRADWRGATAVLEDRSLPRLVLPRPPYAVEPIRFYAEGVEEVRPGMRIGEIVVIGHTNPDRLPREMLGLPLSEAERVQFLGVARYRAPSLTELGPEGLDALGSFGPGLWQSSADDER